MPPAAAPPAAAPPAAAPAAAAPAEAAGGYNATKKKPAAAVSKAGNDAAVTSAQQPAPGRMWEVNSQELRLTDQIIGKGSFCSVVKGIFNGAVVAVKLPHNMQAITEQVRGRSCRRQRWPASLYLCRS
jgi:hypothetical protein